MRQLAAARPNKLNWLLMVVTCAVLVVSVFAFPAPASAYTTGSLRAGQWKKVLWGWYTGVKSYDYYVQVYDLSGHTLYNVQYDCYASYWPWPIRSGRVSGWITHTMAPYGDCWLRSPVNAIYQITP